MFDKEQFIKDSTEQSMKDVDELVVELKLDEGFAAFPEVLAGYRRMLTIAWSRGAGWGFERGLNVQRGLDQEIVNKIVEARRAELGG